LLAVDVSNLIVRHHSVPYGSDFDLAGRPISGVCGAVRQIVGLVKRERPTHLLLARDGKRSDSFRREISDGYKAHRSDADEDLARQFELAYAAFEALGWACVAAPAYEADDILASAAAAFPGDTVVVTGDKDLLAVCTDTTEVCLLRNGGAFLRCGPDGCAQVMGVTPGQVRDFKALAGDSSDGIPGVAGVGPKTAVELLGRYGSLAGIYQHLDAGHDLDGVRPHIARKVADGRDQARLSWRLAGLVATIAVDCDTWAIDGPLTTPEDRADELRDLGLGALLKDAPGRVVVDHANTQGALTRLFEVL
jgi:DNA polymerase-1